MNEKWFLPFMVLFGDEGNTHQKEGCGGCWTIAFLFVLFLLCMSICSSIVR